MLDPKKRSLCFLTGGCDLLHIGPQFSSDREMTAGFPYHTLCEIEFSCPMIRRPGGFDPLCDRCLSRFERGEFPQASFCSDYLRTTLPFFFQQRENAGFPFPDLREKFEILYQVLVQITDSDIDDPSEVARTALAKLTKSA